MSSYLRGAVTDDDVDSIVNNIINGNHADARRAINGFPKAMVGCVVLLVLDKLLEPSDNDDYPELSDKLYWLLEVEARIIGIIQEQA